MVYIGSVAHFYLTCAVYCLLCRNCGFSQSLKEGGNCVERGVRCGSDISGEGPSFGLDTVMTVYHCGRAIHDCAGFISDCF